MRRPAPWPSSPSPLCVRWPPTTGRSQLWQRTHARSGARCRCAWAAAAAPCQNSTQLPPRPGLLAVWAAGPGILATACLHDSHNVRHGQPKATASYCNECATVFFATQSCIRTGVAVGCALGGIQFCMFGSFAVSEPGCVSIPLVVKCRACSCRVLMHIYMYCLCCCNICISRREVMCH